MKEFQEKVGKSTKPLTKIIQKADGFKVIAVGLNKGVALKEHKAPARAKILVIKGKIRYASTREIAVLDHFDQYEIPLDEFHEVTGLEESIFLLLIG